MQTVRNARPTESLAAGWERAKSKGISLQNDYTMNQQVAIQVNKHGKQCTIAKIVIANPLGELVLAMPYKNRRKVGTVSIPPVALKHGRACGCKSWIVRYDNDGECFRLPLENVEKQGWLKTSEGEPEFFVPLSKFLRIAWQTWPYVTESVNLTPTGETDIKQLAFWEVDNESL